MTTTTPDEMTNKQMSPKEKPDPTADEVAVELVRLGKDAGPSLTGPAEPVRSSHS